MNSRFFENSAEAVRLELVSVRGSAPRAAGTVMYVSPDSIEGTIGGGRLELIAIEAARKMLAAGAADRRLDVPLGPEIGQCCGGHVAIGLQRLDGDALRREREKLTGTLRERPAVYIFGAGHVGRALAAAASLLPVRTVLVDEREEQLALCQASVEKRLTPLPEAEIRGAPPGSAFVVLTHDHALDFIISAEALMRGDAAYVGMIGSRTKRVSFERWCAKSNASVGDTASLVCPIGAAGSGDKRPEVIAAFVAAEVIARLTGARPSVEVAAEQVARGEPANE